MSNAPTGLRQRIIDRLAYGPATTEQLATDLTISKPEASRIAGRLVNDGLAVRAGTKPSRYALSVSSQGAGASKTPVAA